MTDKTTRAIIRNAAEDRDCAYRITRDGKVHFHGTMPNSNVVGWWLYAQSIDEAVAKIEGRIA